MFIQNLLVGITFAFAAAVQPGPLMAYIISETMRQGWKPTLPVAFAPLISDIPIAALIIFLLSNVPDSFIIILRFGGGLFVIYLAYASYVSWRRFNQETFLSQQPNKSTLSRAVVVNLLNPGPYLGWSLILGPLFLEGWRTVPINGIILVVSFYLTMIICLTGLIALFGLARKIGPKVCRSLIGLSALALLLFGLYQLVLGIGMLNIQ